MSTPDSWTAASSGSAAAVLAADSFASTFVWSLVLMGVCLIPALFLPRRPPPVRKEGDEDATTPPVLAH